MGYVHNPDTDRTDLMLLDAQTLDTVAAIHLPTRVPNGFHGNWAPTPERHSCTDAVQTPFMIVAIWSATVTIAMWPESTVTTSAPVRSADLVCSSGG